jgi:hypothetical protein
MARNDNWIPACGGTEQPFTTRVRRRLLYCWQPSTGKHAYLDCDTDIILSNDEAMDALGMF